MEIINPTELYVVSQADRSKFIPLTTEYLSSLGYPISGQGKAAVLTYQVNNPAISLSGDIELGAVEIKDGLTDTRVTVQDGSTMPTSADAMAVSDPNAHTILTDIKTAVEAAPPSEVEQVPDTVANTKVVQLGAIAQETVPTAVADGDAVALWADLYGKLITFGDNLALNAKDVNQINQATLNRLGPITMANAVELTGAHTAVDVSNYHNYTVHVFATDSAAPLSAVDVSVESSIDGSTFTSIADLAITAVGNYEVAVSQQAYAYLRTNITGLSGGSITTKLYCGN